MPPGIQRILDANVNRAAEGLRVVEDYLRFALDDGHLGSWCKRLRHALADRLAALGDDRCILARDAGRDVGRSLKTAQELHRPSDRAVIQANLKRVQQALRSLEEWTKTISPSDARALEQLRYEIYELESAVARTMWAAAALDAPCLYVLIDGGSSRADFDRRVQPLFEAGVQVLQLRDKRLSDRELIERGRRLKELSRGTSTRVIVNDRPDLARAIDADGVHLGQDDVPVSVARRILGPTSLIGVSTHDIQQARDAVAQGASYLGVGPTFPSPTKSFDHFPGLDFVRAVVAEIQLPAFAIGGITLERVDDVLACGMRRLAVSSAVWQAPRPADRCQEFLRRLAGSAPQPSVENQHPSEVRSS